MAADKGVAGRKSSRNELQGDYLGWPKFNSNFATLIAFVGALAAKFASCDGAGMDLYLIGIERELVESLGPLSLALACAITETSVLSRPSLAQPEDTRQ